MDIHLYTFGSLISAGCNPCACNIVLHVWAMQTTEYHFWVSAMKLLGCVLTQPSVCWYLSIILFVTHHPVHNSIDVIIVSFPIEIWCVFKVFLQFFEQYIYERVALIHNKLLVYYRKRYKQQCSNPLRSLLKAMSNSNPVLLKYEIEKCSKL